MEVGKHSVYNLRLKNEQMKDAGHMAFASPNCGSQSPNRCRSDNTPLNALQPSRMSDDGSRVIINDN